MANSAGESKDGVLKLDFDRRLMLQLSVVECFETVFGVTERRLRLIWFGFKRLSIGVAIVVFGWFGV